MHYILSMHKKEVKSKQGGSVIEIKPTADIAISLKVTSSLLIGGIPASKYCFSYEALAASSAGCVVDIMVTRML